MTDEILKLAKECGFTGMTGHPALQAFYRAAFNAGLEVAIGKLEEYQIPVGNSRSGELACEWTYAALKEVRDEIRALKEQS